MPRSLFDQPDVPASSSGQTRHETADTGVDADPTIREATARLLPDVPALEDFLHAEPITTEEEVREAGGAVTVTQGRGKHAGKTYHRYRIEGPVVLNGRIQRSVRAGPVEKGSSFEWAEGGGLADEGALRRDLKRIETRIQERRGDGTIRQADLMYLTYLDRTDQAPSKTSRPRIWLTFHEIAVFAADGSDPTVFLYSMAHHILEAFSLPEDAASWPKAIARKLSSESLSLIDGPHAQKINVG